MNTTWISHLPVRNQKYTGVIFRNVMLIAILAVVSFNLLVPIRGMRSDFYPHWFGARMFWNGQTPYAPAITRLIQIGMFGRTLPPEADQQNVAYPAYVSILLTPFTWLPAQVAIAVWMSLQLASLVWAASLWMSILQWRPPPRLGYILVFSLLFIFRYPMDLLVLAQFTGTMLLLVTLGLWLLLHERDDVAGIVLAFSTAPPTIAAPLALMILGAYALHGRWRGLAVFLITLALLTTVSIAKIGWWIPDFVDILLAYAQYAPPTWAPALIPHLSLRVALLVLVLTTLVWVIWRLRARPDVQRQIDVYVVTVLAALLLFPQTGNYYLVLLIPPLLVTLYRANSLPPKWRRLTWLAWGLAVVSPWFYVLIRKYVPDISALLVPAHVGVVWGAVRYMSARYNAAALQG